MCKICQPILGPYTKPHKEAECPLSQAAYCSRCGTNRHFKSECKFKAKPVLFTTQAIPSIKVEKQPNYYAIANTNEAYVDYCRLFHLPVQGTLELNKQTVEEHLTSRGLVLEPPPPQTKRKVAIVRKSGP